ncbi:hypothetical protein D3C81_383590 [compost metagenome]
MPPLRAQGLFPVGVGFDAVAIANVHGGFALEAFNGPLQRGHAPVVHFVEEDIERGFVKLDDVNTGSLQLPGFLVEDLGKLPGQFFTAFIVAVVQRIDHGHGPWQRPFDGLLGQLTQELGIFNENRFLTGNSTDNGGDARVIAITNPDRFPLLEINAAQVLDEGRDEVLTGLLAITDDIDAGVLLLLQGQAQRILFAFDQFLILKLPGRPERLGLSQPGGFRQTTGSRCG